MLIPLREITAEAKTMFKSATDADRLIFQQWAVSALKQLGPTKDNIDIATLYPTDFKLRKPDNLSSSIDIALFTDAGVELPNTYQPGGNRIHTKKYTNINTQFIEVSEDQYYFNLSTDSVGVSYAVLRYFTLPLDESNQPLIPEVFRLAILMYIRWMWSIRQNDSENEKAQSRQDWLVEKASAKGNAKMPSMLEAKKIGTTWVTMISKNFNNSF